MRLYPPQRPKRQCLVFSPLAWLKLQFLCHLGPTEVGAFAISATENPLYVTHILTVKQVTSSVTVSFDDTAVADYFDYCVDQGLKPAQFGRAWIHTHPGSSAMPSGTDEETFRRVFGTTDWAIMAILSRTGRTYARLQVNAGPGARSRLRCRVDWKAWPQELAESTLAQHLEDWQEEFEQNIHPLRLPAVVQPISNPQPILDFNQLQELDSWYGDPFWVPSGEMMHEYPLP